MSGNEEARLRSLVAGADWQPLSDELDHWSNAADRLEKVAESLLKVAAPVADNLGKKTVDAALQAFTEVGNKVNGHAQDIQDIHDALHTAIYALKPAQHLNTKLAGNPMGDPPTFPPDAVNDDDTIDKGKLNKYQTEKKSYDSAAADRETQSKAKADAMEHAYHEAIAVLKKVPDDKTPEVAGPGGTGGSSTGGQAPSVPGGTTPGVPADPHTPHTPHVPTDPHPHPPHVPEPPHDPGLPPHDPHVPTPHTPYQPTPHDPYVPGHTPGHPGYPGHGGLDPYSTGHGSGYTPSGGYSPSGGVAPTPGGPGSLSALAVGGAAGAGVLGGFAGGIRGAGLAAGAGAGGLRSGGVLGSTGRGVGSARGSLGGRGGVGGAAGAAGSTTGRGASGRAGSRAAGSRGAAGGRGAGGGAGAGAAGGRGKDKNKKKQPPTVELFDEDSDWIDDEGASSGVID